MDYTISLYRYNYISSFQLLEPKMSSHIPQNHLQHNQYDRVWHDIQWYKHHADNCDYVDIVCVFCSALAAVSWFRLSWTSIDTLAGVQDNVREFQRPGISRELFHVISAVVMPLSLTTLQEKEPSRHEDAGQWQPQMTSCCFMSMFVLWSFSRPRILT